MPLRVGQVIVTEVNRKSLFSRLIARRTGSQFTHALIYVGRGMAVEATFPMVRWAKWEDKLEQLRANDQAYAVLDLPGIKLPQRGDLVWHVMQFVGRIYDVGQLVLFAVTGKFWNDGPGTLECTRLVTAAYQEVGVDLFDAATLSTNFPADFPRLDNLRAGAATPGDLLRSKLEVVDFVPSSSVRTLADLTTPY